MWRRDSFVTIVLRIVKFRDGRLSPEKKQQFLSVPVEENIYALTIKILGKLTDNLKPEYKQISLWFMMCLIQGWSGDIPLKGHHLD